MNTKYIICGIYEDNITKYAIRSAKDINECYRFLMELLKGGFLQGQNPKTMIAELKSKGKLFFTAYDGDGRYVIANLDKIVPLYR